MMATKMVSGLKFGIRLVQLQCVSFVFLTCVLGLGQPMSGQTA